MLNLRQALAALTLASVSSLPAKAAPTSLQLMLDGVYFTSDTTSNNTHIEGSLVTGQSDTDPWERIGEYRLDSFSLDFARLSPRFTAPFALHADPAQSTLHIYPRWTDQDVGEVRLFGRFQDGTMLPNGVLMTDYVLSLYFETVADDTLSSLQSLGELRSASLYFGGSGVAYSNRFDYVTASFTERMYAVDEPASLPLAMLAFGTALSLVRSRRRMSMCAVNSTPSSKTRD